MARRTASGFLVLGLLAAPAMASAQSPSPPTGTYDLVGIGRSVSTRPVNGTCSDPSTQDGSTSFHYFKGTIQFLGHDFTNLDFDDTIVSLGQDGKPTSTALHIGCQGGNGTSSGGQFDTFQYCYYVAQGDENLHLSFSLDLQGSLSPTQIFLQNSVSSDGHPETLTISRNDVPTECVTPTVLITGLKN